MPDIPYVAGPEMPEEHAAPEILNLPDPYGWVNPEIDNVDGIHEGASERALRRVRGQPPPPTTAQLDAEARRAKELDELTTVADISLAAARRAVADVIIPGEKGTPPLFKEALLASFPHRVPGQDQLEATVPGPRIGPAEVLAILGDERRKLYDEIAIARGDHATQKTLQEQLNNVKLEIRDLQGALAVHHQIAATAAPAKESSDDQTTELLEKVLAGLKRL